MLFYSFENSRKLFIWQVQVQSYKSGKKHNIIESYKYSQETEAKVQEYRYRQSHLSTATAKATCSVIWIEPIQYC